MAVRVATRAPARTLAAAVPAWAWLTGIVVVSALFRYALARRIHAPWIMVDELIYSELARGVAAGDGFSIRGVTTYAYGFVYPLLVAPAYLIDELPQAYAVVKAINSVLMSLAAVPAYFLARRVLPVGLSLFAALLAVALPSLLYAGEVMTENAFYPLFLTVMLAFVATLERPTPTRQLGLLALCALAYLTRAQALALFPAVVLAPVLAGSWRSFRVLYGTLGGVALLAIGAQLARGESPLGLLGAYAVAGEHEYVPRDVAKWLLYHVAELDLYLGVVPFAALIVLVALWTRLPRVVRPFLAATTSVSVFLLLEVSAFASLPSVQRIEERNLFYLAPLALIALLVWVDQGLPRPPLAAGVAAVLAAAFPALVPYERLIGVPSQSDTLMLLALWRVHERWVALDDVVAVVVAASVVAAIAFLVVPRRFGLVLPLAVLAFFLAVTRPISARMEYAAEGALAEGMNKQHRDWIDGAVGDGGEVIALWTGNSSRFSIWQNELFNRSVGRVLSVETAMEGGLPTTVVDLDRRTGELRAGGQHLHAPYALSDGSAELVGEVVAADARRNVFLYRVEQPLRQASVVEGLHANDTWSGPLVTYRRFDCAGGSLAVALQSDPALYQAPSRVRVEGTAIEKRVPPDGRAHTLVVPLPPSCVVRFSVSPTRVPGPNDPRRLGLHFNSFRYRP